MQLSLFSDQFASLRWVDDQHILHAFVPSRGIWRVELISIPDGDVLNSISSDESTALGLEVIRDDLPYPRMINLDGITSNSVLIALDYLYIYEHDL